MLDNSTAWSMAGTPDVNSGQCVVGVNDVVYYIAGAAMWQSTNLGTIFTPITPSSSSTYLGSNTLGARESHAAIIYSPSVGKDTIVVMGGGGGLKAGFANDGQHSTTERTSSCTDLSDTLPLSLSFLTVLFVPLSVCLSASAAAAVWSSADYGNTWQALTLSAGWSPRQSPQVAVGLNGVMALYGGMAYTGNTASNTYGWSWYGDVWLSLNGGSVWYQMTSQSAGGARAMGSMLVDRSGYLYVADGESGWSNWLSSTYRSRYSLYNIQQWLPSVNASIAVPAALCGTTTGPGLLLVVVLSLERCDRRHRDRLSGRCAAHLRRALRILPWRPHSWREQVDQVRHSARRLQNVVQRGSQRGGSHRSGDVVRDRR